MDTLGKCTTHHAQLCLRKGPFSTDRSMEPGFHGVLLWETWNWHTGTKKPLKDQSSLVSYRGKLRLRGGPEASRGHTNVQKQGGCLLHPHLESFSEPKAST